MYACMRQGSGTCVCQGTSVCARVCVRDREPLCVCVCVREPLCVRQGSGTCVCVCVCVSGARVLCAASYEGKPESDGHAPALPAVEGEPWALHPCEEDEDLGQAARPLREASQAGGLEVRDTPSRGVEGAEEQSPRTGWLSLSCSPKRGEHPPTCRSLEARGLGEDMGRDRAQAAGSLLRAAPWGEAGTDTTDVNGEPATLNRGSAQTPEVLWQSDGSGGRVPAPWPPRRVAAPHQSPPQWSEQDGVG